MRVYIGRNGVSAHSVNDKAKISHEIEQKTALSKRSDGVISNRNVRSAGGDDTGIKPTDMPRGSPSAAARKKEHFDKAAQQIARATAKLVQAAARAVTGAVSKLVGLIADGVLSVLNAAGSGYSNWLRSGDKNSGYPYPSKIKF